MENKDLQGALLSQEPGGVKPAPDTTLHIPPPESSTLSEPTDSQMLISQEQPPSGPRRFLRFARRIDVILAVLLLLAGAVILFGVFNNNRQKESLQPAVASNFGTVKIPLEELVGGKDLSLSGAANVTINGSMQLNNALLLSPSLQPTGAKPGQLYYDQTTNQLAYFNGRVFVFLTAPIPETGGVQSLGGTTGRLTLGSGLSLTNGQLSNSGVLSVQGQSGNVAFTAGPGLIINGTTFSNSGVLSIASGSPNVTVANDGNGGVTISMTGAGTGTVASSGGTVGHVPLFTASQNIEDSIIAQSGMTVTINGDLSVITGGLSLANALTVSNGGTGATSFANNGVLVGQGTGAFAAVAAGGAGLCLMSTGGLPTWGACPGGTGVTSLNGLTGGLNIANASGAGSTITLDNASTSAKGIASFNATNFSVSSGAVNTIQNINTGATPTFAGLNTNSITPSAGLTIGSTSQTLTLQGSATTTLTATNGANTTALSFVSPTANVSYRLQTASAGTYDICTTAGNCSTSGGVTTPGGTTNRLAKFTGAQVIGDSIIVDNGSNVDVGGTLSVQGVATFVGDLAVNGGDITSSGALNITPAGTLTIGVAGQQLTLQGNASTSLSATNGANTTVLTFQSPSANVTYRLPTAAAGTYDICTTAGNCVGSGGGVTTSGGTTNRLAKFTGAQSIGDSTISDNGTNVTTSVDLIIQGGDVFVGVANSQTGSINMAHSGSSFVGTILQGALTANRTYTLPDADGTICLTSGNCSGAGSPNTLQAAYDAGNTITTSTSRDIAISLADSSTDSNFTVTASTGATGYVGILRADGAGTADPAQLLLIDNLDVDRVQPVGLKIQAAGGGMTTAIDLTDAEIITAISIGANDILGTTGNIDLSNFDVVGATGNITAAGTINGQTISSAASFTGTVAIAGNATLTSDLAVNGGDITSSGALNITPAGTFTVGATGQQLVLQGNAGTLLTATGGGFTTSVGFAGTPAAAVTYNFDRAAAAGTYTICTSVGNCATAGGVTTPGGTTGALAKFTGAQTIGDSLLSESGGVVTVNGNLNLVSGNQYRINGTQISSADLSNDANLAKLNASQTFTGNTVAFQNGTNSSNAFNVQNVAGHRIMTIDSSSAQLVLGTASTLDGRLVFSNVSNANTVTILPGTPTANRTLTLPDASGVICTDSGNCAGAGATLQTAYNFSVGGTTPKIKVNSSLGGVDIQDADTPIGANLLNIRASNGAGLGSVIFGVGNTGEVTLQNSANSTTAFRLLTAGGTSILTGDTTNGQILLGQSSTLNGTVVFRNASNTNTITLVSGTATTGRTITLPDADGTVCLTSGNCSGAGTPNTLQAAYDAGNTIASSNARDLSFTLANTATDSNFTIDIASDSTGYTAIRRADGAGTNDPSQILLIENLDTDRVQPTALRIQAAAGGITTAIDLSDPEILTAFNTGANDITGTNYGIAGATGTITTAGDLAVNGGDITSSGALNITPGGTLTVGVAGQQIILQGNASTQLIANGGGFATTIGFTGTPTGNVTYNFDRASTAGTYSICTSAAVCSGYQSALTFNNGLTNTSGTVQLGGSLLQNTTIAAGNAFGLTLTSDLSGGNRSTPALSITQANSTGGTNTSSLLTVTNSDTTSSLAVVNFTQNASGTVLSLNGSGSTAVQVNTAATGRAIDINTAMTTGTAIGIDAADLTSGTGLLLDGGNNGSLSAFTGSLIEASPSRQMIGGSGTLTDTGNFLRLTRANTINSSGRTWNMTGDLAALSSNCTQTAGTCTDSSRILSLNQQYANATGTVLSVQNAGSGNLLELGNSSTVLARFAANGNLTLGSTSTAGRASFTDGTGNAFTNSIITTTLTANRTITLPDASGTICLQSSSACGFVTGTPGNYIQNTTTVQTNASIAIQSAADANVTALFKQRPTQSADLLRIVDSSDGLIFNIDTFGNSTLTGNMTINEYLGVGVANDSGIALNVSSDLSNTQIGLKVSSVTSGQTADVAQFFGPSSRSMTYGANGTLTVKAGSSQTASLLEIQSAAGGVFGSLTAGGQLTLGRIAASGTVGAGTLILADGTTSNFGATLNTTTLSASRTITLPDADGTVCLQGSTNCSFAAASCVLTGTYICNGGNTPVSSVAIGTTNAQPLNFMTNSATRASISSTGIFQVFGNGTGSARVGGDCGSNYTAINLGGTTAFDCTSYNLLSGPTDTSLYINRPSGSSIFVREGNSSTNHLSIAGGGAFTAQNTTDSSAGFRVLNSGSVPLFQIDTTSTRVYIGNPTGDTTGALLVLDTKTDASDPTGVEGGMYFSSFYKRLRCYYDGQWRFCNDPVGLTYGYNFEEDFIGGGNNFGSHNWTQAVSGAGSIVSGAGPDSSTRPGQIQLSIGTVASGTNFSSLYLNGNSAETLLLGNTNGTRIEVEFAASIPTLADATNDYNVHVGLCDDIPSASCANGIYFEYDRDQSVNWRFGAANGGSRTLNNSSTAVTSGWHRFKMVYTYSSTGPTAAIEYFVDGVSIGTHTNTNVPTTNTTQPQFDIMRDAGAGTADRILIADYFQYRSTLTSPR